MPRYAGCGLRLILKTTQLELLAASPAEAVTWVSGVNRLPLGSKHLALLALVRQHHAELLAAAPSPAPAPTTAGAAVSGNSVAMLLSGAG